jgi:hypothetical protein
MNALLLVATGRDRIDARGPSPDPSVTAGGQLLAVARRCHDRDTWIVRLKDDQTPRFIEGEQATRTFLASLGGGR